MVEDISTTLWLQDMVALKTGFKKFHTKYFRTESAV